MLVFLAFAFAGFFSFPLPLLLLQVKLNQSRGCNNRVYTIIGTCPLPVLQWNVDMTHALHLTVPSFIHACIKDSTQQGQGQMALALALAQGTQKSSTRYTLQCKGCDSFTHGANSGRTFEPLSALQYADMGKKATRRLDAHT